MRTWGRVNNEGEWLEIETTPDGFNDAVMICTLAQVLLLNRGESPFYGNYGIPAEQSVVSQLFPDFYVTETQQQFSGFFASLTVARVPAPNPFYLVNVTGNQGFTYPAMEVPI